MSPMGGRVQSDFDKLVQTRGRNSFGSWPVQAVSLKREPFHSIIQPSFSWVKARRMPELGRKPGTRDSELTRPFLGSRPVQVAQPRTSCHFASAREVTGVAPLRRLQRSVSPFPSSAVLQPELSTAPLSPGMATKR